MAKKLKTLYVGYLLVLMIFSMSAYSKYTVFIVLPVFLFLISKSFNSNYIYFKKFRSLLLIFIIGCLSGVDDFFSNNSYFIKDLIYFIQPVIFLFFGFLICNSRNDLILILRIAVLSTLVISLFAAFNIIRQPQLLLNINLDSRYESHTSNIFGLISFVILFFTKKTNLRLFKPSYENLIMVVSFLVILTSLSRTYYFLLILVFLLQKDFIFRKIQKFSFLIFVFVLFMLFGNLVFDYKIESVTQDATFINKVKNSLSEISIHNYKYSSEIVNNWRGYEGYLGVSSFYEGSFSELIFGKGFGTIVSPPNWIFEEESALDNIPFFHNGFVTILLKTGIFGLFLFFYFLNIFFKFSNKNLNYADYLIVYFICFVIVQTFVVHGLYKSSTAVIVLILLGSLYKSKLKFSKLQ